MKSIRVPALVVNAIDDPFLSRACYPTEHGVLGSHVSLEAPRFGGHVGFVERSSDGYYWSERRAVAFFRAVGA